MTKQTNNPFDWRNYTPTVSMRQADTARKTSYQQTSVINRTRAAGIEPSIIYSAKTINLQPRNFVAEMPVMPKYDEGAARRQAKREKGKA